MPQNLALPATDRDGNRRRDLVDVCRLLSQLSHVLGIAQIRLIAEVYQPERRGIGQPIVIQERARVLEAVCLPPSTSSKMMCI